MHPIHVRDTDAIRTDAIDDLRDPRDPLGNEIRRNRELAAEANRLRAENAELRAALGVDPDEVLRLRAEVERMRPVYERHLDRMNEIDRRLAWAREEGGE